MRPPTTLWRRARGSVYRGRFCGHWPWPRWAGWSTFTPAMGPLQCTTRVHVTPWYVWLRVVDTRIDGLQAQRHLTITVAFLRGAGRTSTGRHRHDSRPLWCCLQRRHAPADRDPRVRSAVSARHSPWHSLCDDLATVADGARRAAAALSRAAVPSLRDAMHASRCWTRPAWCRHVVRVTGMYGAAGQTGTSSLGGMQSPASA